MVVDQAGMDVHVKFAILDEIVLEIFDDGQTMTAYVAQHLRQGFEKSPFQMSAN